MLKRLHILCHAMVDIILSTTRNMIKERCVHKFLGEQLGAEINLKQLFSLCDNCISPRYSEYVLLSTTFFFVIAFHEEIYIWSGYLTRSTCSNEHSLLVCAILRCWMVNDDDDEEEKLLAWYGMKILLNIIFFLFRV